jgi:hypothetical protein
MRARLEDKMTRTTAAVAVTTFALLVLWTKGLSWVVPAANIAFGSVL